MAERLVLHDQIDLEMLKCADFYFRAARGVAIFE